MNRPPTPVPAPAHPRRTELRSWRRLMITLPADAPELLSPLRTLVVANLIDWGVEEGRAQDVELAVSELVTNALRHSDGPVRVYLAMRAGAVHLEVSDTSIQHTAHAGAALDDEHGRGLHIVKALAFTVNTRIHPRWGKTIAASFDLG